MKILIILLLLIVGCKKEEEIITKNVFYEIASPSAAKFHVKIIDDKNNIIEFDSVTTGWNWQKLTEVGNVVAIEATKQTMLDSVTIDSFRLKVNGQNTKQIIDTGSVKTISIWSKISE